MHLSTGRKESEIPYLNRAHRNNTLIDASLLNSDGYYARPDNMTHRKSLLEPFLIKDIYLKLIIPKFVNFKLNLINLNSIKVKNGRNI